MEREKQLKIELTKVIKDNDELRKLLRNGKDNVEKGR